MKRGLILLQVLLLLLTTAGSMGEVSPPTLTPPAGTYLYGTSVSLSSTTPGAQIYYTTDTSTPSQSTAAYTSPIVMTQHASVNHDPDPLDENPPLSLVSYTLKAIATKDGWTDSPVVGANIIIDRVEHFFNLAYDAAPGGACSNKHLLDIYRPRGQNNTPVVFFVHGGAWHAGDKNIYLELGNTLAGDYQMTTVIINYRLTNDACGAQHPQHIQDVAKAFQWVVNHIAGYGGDPQNIHIFGQSAGGHLVSLLATDEQYLNALGLSTGAIQSVTSMSGAYNLSNFVMTANNPLQLSDAQIDAYRALFLLVFGNLLPQTLLDASPGYHANANQPPVHIIGLTESDGFYDMPGFHLDAGNFYNQVHNLNGPPVALSYLTKEDIPPAVLALNFPDFIGDIDGHYEEIYAINTLNWNSISTLMTATYIKSQLPLQLTRPNGGEILPPASPQTVTWNSRTSTATVRLQYSKDDGETWITINDSAPNSGSYQWQTPLIHSQLMRMRISETAVDGHADMSTQVFVISPPRQIHLPLIEYDIPSGLAFE
jgi:hypothetical protein